MSKFYILSYDGTYINPAELDKLVKELRKDFSDCKFYTIMHLNHKQKSIHLLNSDGITVLPR